jgi:pilin isopeptide linkage protein
MKILKMKTKRILAGAAVAILLSQTILSDVSAAAFGMGRVYAAEEEVAAEQAPQEVASEPASEVKEEAPVAEEKATEVKEEASNGEEVVAESEVTGKDQQDVESETAESSKEETLAEETKEETVETETEETEETETEETEETEELCTKSVYTYSGNGVTVTATLSNPNVIPDDAEFRVTPITSGTAYNAYLAAMDKADSTKKHDAENTVLFDVAFLVNENGKLVEFEPEQGSVQIKITFNNKQLEKIDAKNEEVKIVHLPLKDSVMNRVDKSVDASNISVNDIQTEVLTETKASGETLNFSMNSFSTVGATLSVSSNNVTFSQNLNEFLTDATIDTKGKEPQDGKIVINPNDSYGVYFTFKEKTNGAQFHNETMTYTFPNGINPHPVTKDIEIDLPDGRVMKGNTVRIENGKLTITWNQNDPNYDYFKSCGNTKFNFSAEVDISQSVSETQFGTDVEKTYFIFDAGSADIKKEGNFDEWNNCFNYTVTVTANGAVKNIKVTDEIKGNALKYDKNSFYASSNKSLNGANVQHKDNGFVYTVKSMQAGEVITITYKANVDPSKAGSNGKLKLTYDNTLNKVKLEGDDIPDDEDEFYLEKEVSETYLQKDDAAGGEAQGNKRTLSWRIVANEGRRVNMGGHKITDTLKYEGEARIGNHRFSGSGIKVEVYNQNYQQIATRNLPWNQVGVYDKRNNRSWTYNIPREDKNYRYVITYTTEIDTTQMGSNQWKVRNDTTDDFGDSDQGYGYINPPADKTIGLKKSGVRNASNNKGEWTISIDVPADGLSKCVAVDTLPNIWVEGKHFIDTYDQNARVDGLRNKESYKVDYDAKEGKVTFTFYNNKKEGLKGTGSPRTITIKYTTTPNAEWLEYANSHNDNDYYHCAHVNQVSVDSQQAQATIQYPKGKKLDKVGRFYGNNSKGYPVYVYDLILTGVNTDSITITDTFDTAIFTNKGVEHYDPWGYKIIGNDYQDQLNLNDPSKFKEVDKVTPTETGLQITTKVPKNGNSYYRYYKIVYFLTVKDDEGLQLLQDIANQNGGKAIVSNCASWDEAEDNLDLIYEFNPLQKNGEVIYENGKPTDRIRFTLKINSGAVDLDSDKDTLELLDECQNLTILPDSVETDPKVDVTFERTSKGYLFTIPDATALTLKYTCVVNSSKIGKVSWANTASLKGYHVETKDVIDLEEARGRGSASNPKVVVVKHKEGDERVTLAGAKFQLLDSAKQPVTDRDGNAVIAVTDKDGQATFQGDITKYGWVLVEDETYYVRELEAPAGYERAVEDTAFTVTDGDLDEANHKLTISYPYLYIANKKSPAKATIKGLKTLDGRDLTTGEFTFTLEGTNDAGKASLKNNVITVNNDAQGNIIFPEIIYTESGDYTCEYVVKEVKGTEPGVIYDGNAYEVKVEVKDTNGVLSATVKNEKNGVSFNFENTYQVTPTKAHFEAKKVLNVENSEKILKDGEFTFLLSPVDDNAKKSFQDTFRSEKAREVKNKADGSISFETIHYNQAGTYTYTITEKKGNEGGVEYDQTTHTVVVVVSEKDAVLNVDSVTYDGKADTPVFTNTYKPTPAEISFGGRKVLEGKGKNKRDIVKGEFSFELKGANQAGVDSLKDVNTVVTNDEKGEFSFPTITYTKEGTYQYTVTEVAGSNSTITYDKTSYDVEVTVKEKDGELTAEKRLLHHENEIVFKNTYAPGEANVSITATKSVENGELKAGLYTFQLVGNDADSKATLGNNALTATNDASGNVNFGNIKFTEAGDYTYTVSEVNDGKVAGVSYDDTKYTVQIAVSDVNGKLGAVTKITKNGNNADKITFVNRFSKAKQHIEGTKSLTGRDLVNGEFTFELTGEDAASKATLGNKTATTKNAANGTFAFADIAFEKAGTYRYTVSEQIPTETNGVTFDTTKFHAVITVTANENGQLVAAAPVITKDGSATPVALQFENDYKVKPTQTQIKGIKVLNGIRPMRDKEFTFVLKNEATGFSLTAQNDVNGNFAFAPIQYNEAGTYTYVVKEDTTNKSEGVTYDTTVYTVVVVVEDDGKGSLKTPVVTIQNADEIKFVNNYTVADAEATLKAHKTLNGRALKDAEFSFSLEGKDANGKASLNQQVWEAKNNKDGDITFDKITYSQKGEYHYIIKETSRNGKGVTVDTKVHEAKVVVDDDGYGKLVATVTYDGAAAVPEFVNDYQASRTTLVIDGTKELIVPAGSTRTLKEGEFSFSLQGKGEKEAATMTAGNFTGVANDKDGKFSFPELRFTAAGTYEYTVVEEEGHLGGVTYSTDKYNVTVTVVDQLDGTLKATKVVTKAGVPAEGNRIVFKNNYTLKGTQVKIDGEKYLNGSADLKGKEFTYILTGDTANDAKTLTKADYTVKSKDSKFSFPLIQYTEAGTYHYTVKEVNDGQKGVTYDTALYNVTVEVVDDNLGQLHATKTITKAGQIVDSVVFNNTYKADSVSVPFDGTKKLTGRNAKALQKDEFTFTLIDKTGEAKEVQTVGNEANGSFAFDEITYDEEGTYFYEVRENNTNVPGVTYDNTVYTVKVVVEDDLNGKLVATKTITDGEKNVSAIVFTNTYKPGTATFNLEAKKTMEGQSLQGGDFSFTLTDASGKVIETVKNQSDGKIRFTSLTYDKVGTYTYTIKEVNDGKGGVTYSDAEYEVNVVVSDPGTGKLNANASISLNGSNVQTAEFINTYTATPVDKELKGVKTLENRAIGDAEFSFTLTAANDAAKATLPEAGETVVNKGKDFAFTPLHFTEVGEYRYQVKEVSGTLGGVTYDTSVIDVLVTVTDNGEGKLDATETITKGGQPSSLTFKNKYKADQTKVDLTGVKHVDGEGFPLKAGQFSFTLTGVTDADNATLKDGNYTVVNDAQGNFAFPTIHYDKVGTYNYEVRETAGSLHGMTYDTSVYNVTVEVTDDKQGHLEAYPEITKDGEVSDLVFTNTYKADKTDITISGVKSLEGRALKNGEFTFTLIDENGAEAETIATVTNNGANFSFPKLEYTEAGEYWYTVREEVGEEGGVTYSDETYQVVVTVTDDGEGYLHPNKRVLLDEEPAQLVFHNTYEASSTDWTFEGKKNLVGRPLTAEDTFRFVMTEDGTENTYTATTVDATGNFVFPTITYDQVGVHTYTVKEEAGNIRGITYSSEEYKVIVTVKDDLKGALYTEEQIVKGGVEVQSATFTNTYEASPVDAEVAGHKTLTGRTLQAGEFSFLLTGKTEKETATLTDVKTRVSNDANGNFKFTGIHFEKAGTYHYTVAEEKGVLGGVTYATNVEDVTVTVTDQLDGTLKAEVNYANGARPEFVNTYTTEDGKAILHVKKALHGRDMKADEFSFTLKDAQGNVIETITAPAATMKNQVAEANLSFSELNFTEEGTYNYTIQEVVGNKGGITYDSKEIAVVITVVDDNRGHLNATVTYDGAAEVPQFDNYYETKAAKAQLEANKTLNGRAIKNGEFTFTLTATNDEARYVLPETEETVNNGTKVVFSELTFAEEGIYTFEIGEEVGEEENGVAYDTAKHTATVVVTDNGNGQLVATVSYDDAKESITFINDYSSEGAFTTIAGTKELVGRDLTTGEFAFNLRAKSNNAKATLTENGQVVDSFTVRNAADKSFTFPSVSFTEAGTYEYEVSEVKENKGGVTYDTSVYTVKVVVEDDTNGHLGIASKTYQVGRTTKEAITFTNKYESTPTKAQFEISKKLHGRDMVKDEFVFDLVDAQGKVLQTVKVPAAQMENEVATANMQFAEITYDTVGTYTYTIREQKPEGNTNGVKYDEKVVSVTVEVTDNGEGNLENTVVYVKNDAELAAGEVPTFHNYYEVTPTSAAVKAHKTITGRHLVEGEFSFELVGVSENAKGTKATAVNTVVSNSDTGIASGHGDVNFGSISYTTAGVYRYEIRETSKDANGVTVDKKVYPVVITVTDKDANGKSTGKLVATVEYQQLAAGETEPIIKNWYEAEGTKAHLEATKELVGRTLQNEEFTFEVTEPNGQRTIPGGKLTAKNNADGQVVFADIHFDKVGTYTYTIKEVEDQSKLGTTFDLSSHTAVITVSEKLDANGTPVGQLQATVSYDGQDAEESVAPKFVNETVLRDLQVRKSFLGNDFLAQTGEVSFQLYKVEGGKEVAVEGKSITLTCANQDEDGRYHWTREELVGKFTGLPAYDESDKLISYLVKETTEGDFEIRYYDENQSNANQTAAHYDSKNFVVGQTAEVLVENCEFTTYTGTKTWYDFHNKYGVRPGQIQVTLYQRLEGQDVSEAKAYTDKNGKTFTKAISGEDDTWEYSFEHLPIYDDNGVKYIYSVTEDYVTYDGHVTADSANLRYYTGDGNHTSVGFVSGDMNLNNTLTTVNVNGTKVWDDEWDSSKRPESIIVRLVANGAVLKDAQGNDICQEVTADAEGNWSFTFENVPNYYVTVDGEVQAAITYAVTEDPVEGYTAVVTGNAVDGFVITNTYETTKLAKAYIVKVDAADQNKALAGATFGLYHEDGSLVGYYTSDANGIVIADSLKEGNYFFRETAAPAGYKLNQTMITFTITAEQDKQGLTLYVGKVINEKTPETPDNPGGDNPNTPEVLGAKRDILTPDQGQVLGVRRAPKTSDASKALLWMLVMGGSGIGAAIMMAQQRRSRNKLRSML